MKSAIRVSDVCLSMLSGFAATVLFLGASALPAHAVDPKKAIANATVQWTINNSPGWSLGDTDYSDDGGSYYLSYIDSPWGLNCTVTNRGTVKSQKATITWTQHFNWNGDPMAVDPLPLGLQTHADAYYAIDGQTAHAKAQTQITSGDIKLKYNAEATAVMSDTPNGFTDNSTFTYNNPPATGLTSIGTTEADVTTP